jgi:hypothetical protein
MYKYLFTVLNKRIRVSICDSESSFSTDVGDADEHYGRLFQLLEQKQWIKGYQQDDTLVLVISKLDPLTFTGYVKQFLRSPKDGSRNAQGNHDRISLHDCLPDCL